MFKTDVELNWSNLTAWPLLALIYSNGSLVLIGGGRHEIISSSNFEPEVLRDKAGDLKIPSG